jgi:hypothetical protein
VHFFASLWTKITQRKIHLSRAASRRLMLHTD